MIQLRQVAKSFDRGSTFAVQPLSFEVAEGETLVLLGSSGCGKTTTLKMINRLIDPTSGTILVDGVDVMDRDPVELRRSIGYVFQRIGLFPHLTVAENAGIVLQLLGRPADERHARACELLSMVELDPEIYADRLPAELSGGQQQRVGVARALAADPAYLLMDEPFGALDAVTRDGLQQEVIELKQRLQKTIIFVTHDIIEAITLADRIAVMHDGVLDQIGTPAELRDSPATDFVRDLFEKPARQLAMFAGGAA